MPDAHGPATMADVARRAGVSVATVSRALRGLPSVSPEAQARVEKAARELSFAISRSASSLASGRTGRVAVLTPGIHEAPWFLGTALTGLASGCSEADLDLLLYCITRDTERSTFFDRLPARRNADALLVVSFALTEDERKRLDELGMPVVFVSQHMPGRAGVCVDDVAGAQLGMRHLLNLGHRRIAYLQSVSELPFVASSNERVIGYRQALEGAGLPYDASLVIRATYTRRGLREAVGDLLSLPELPTAVFVEDDQTAFEVLAILRSSGVEVPGRMSVLGFDDHPLSEALGLTTVAQPAERIGRTAAEIVTELLTDPGSDAARHIVLPTHLVPRATTSPPPTSERVPAERSVMDPDQSSA